MRGQKIWCASTFNFQHIVGPLRGIALWNFFRYLSELKSFWKRMANKRSFRISSYHWAFWEGTRGMPSTSLPSPFGIQQKKILDESVSFKMSTTQVIRQYRRNRGPFHQTCVRTFLRKSRKLLRMFVRTTFSQTIRIFSLSVSPNKIRMFAPLMNDLEILIG